ncbi:hypothetical protein H072_10320 [Dactylellina haptotyla CBS 200.50]|uniref:Uncharacterized protein n=1 Tax=Dactylellina haptotyla (strain CBS 200.50) TaxID=1284197 RepID=S8A0H3_DACHA|nr:hypothetical protein H072_10320 [Dactylellina haptotyla CBS 200.50]
MPITLRHVTADSTWIITLTSPHDPPSHPPYNIILDPWITGPSPVWHPKFAQNHHTIPFSLFNLSELTPQPDLLLISQTKTDHCNEATCRQLPKDGIKVYAVPGADSIVKSWKHFTPSNVHRLRPYNSNKTGRVSRVPIYKDADAASKALEASKKADKYKFENDPNVAAIVELAFMPALKPWEIPSIHIGLGITYTPLEDPSDGDITNCLPPSPPLTPPSTTYLHPNSSATDPSQSTSSLSTVPSNQSSTVTSTFNSQIPTSPNRFPKKQQQPSPLSISTKKEYTRKNLKRPGRKSASTESILYTPHGVPPSALTNYLASIPLPLTAFIHCFVKVDNPKWLGGTVSAGLPNALKIISSLKGIRGEQSRRSEEPVSPRSSCSHDYGLGVKYLVSTHDEEVEMEGFCSYFVKKRKWGVEDVMDQLKQIAGDDEAEVKKGKEADEKGKEAEEENQTMWSGPAGVRLLDLGPGEDAVLA